MKFIYYLINTSFLLGLTTSAFTQLSTNRNYVSSSVIKQAGITTQSSVDALGVQGKNTQVNYFDGLGRPLQTVAVQASPAGKDLVTAIEYDGYGREIKKFLPYPDAGLTYGSFKTSVYADQANYYNSSSAGSMEDDYPFSQIFYEFSPLNRIKEQGAAGQSWQVGNGHVVKTIFTFNTTADDVKRWTVTDNGGSFGSYTMAGSYTASELYKTIIEDEQGKQVIEFKDREGKVILKKVQLTATPDNVNGNDYAGWLCTYYIYDEFNHLRCVIQPKAVEELAKPAINWATSTTILDELCFRYEYDEKGRMTMKKVPGAGEVYMVYDKRDRLTMTQDANMRTGTAKWLVTIYDDLNRAVKTGLWADGNSRSYHEGQAITSPYYYYPFNTEPGSNWELLTETHYNDYSGLPSGLTSTFNASGYSTYLNATSSENADAVPTNPSSFTKGLVTWTKIEVLDPTGHFNSTVNLYDDKGRVVQTQSINVTGGLDVVTNQYSFSGQVLRNHVRHQKTSSDPVYQVATKNTYDDLGRVTTIEKALNGSTTYKQISSLSYDALGQLKTKTLGSTLETLNYDYNIRGWLLGMNRDYVKDANSTSKFGFDLGYEKNGVIGSYTPLYNGNIAGMVWKSTGDQQKRKYDFTYDAVNRLTGADFNQWVSGSGSGAVFNKSAGIDFGVSNLTYDYNGNIITQKQNGWKINGSTAIDDMTYGYAAYSNKLLTVTEAAGIGSTDNKLGDFTDKNRTGNDYDYDANGNLKIDNNKNISSITYNYLNLPGTITVTGKGSIDYVYDASGNKLKKVVHENGQPDKTTSYLFGTYENDVLQFFPHEEGRIRLRTSDNTFQYDYFIKDHLGNVRMVLTDESKTEQYPAATLEASTISSESSYYSNLTTTQYSKPSWFSDPVYTSSTQVARVKNSAGSQKVGPAILLKVMAGDSYNIRAASGWSSGSSSTNSPTEVINDLVLALSGGLAGTSGGKATQAQLQDPSSGLSTGVSSFLSTQTNTGAPKAYINWILFDEQFKYYSGGFEQVGGSGATTIHSRNGLAVGKSGYLYVYTSNESQNIDVFFDNLQVTHVRGPIVEETHYYPFGLVMSGISSKAVAFGGAENKRKFNNGTELNSDFDINLYETNFRSLDPQLGRFWQIDPLSMTLVSLSPYQFATNNPILFNDPFGLDTVRVNGEGAHKIKIRQGDILAWTIGETTSYYTYDPSNPDAVNGFVGEGMKAPDQPEVVVTASTPKDKTTPWQLGAEWATGRGPREHHFGQTDPFTRLLMKHEHITDTKNMIANQIYNGARGNIQGTNNYQLGGLGGVPKYIRDYSTLLTGGLTGNLAVTYLGSYGLKYEVVSIDEQNGTAQVHFFVSNTSTIESATHPPVIGYTQWWSNNIGKPLNNYFSSGAFSKTTQTVEWTETIQWK